MFNFPFPIFLLFLLFLFFLNFFISFNRQFLGLLLTFSFGTTMTDQCRTNFYVNPSDSVVAIMDDERDSSSMTRYDRKTSLMNSCDLTSDGWFTKNCILDANDFNESWLDRTTLVYADEVMPMFVFDNPLWFNGQTIPPVQHTWPKPSSDKVIQTAITTLFNFVVLVGPNVYKNRWCGWGSVLLPMALYISFDNLRMQGRDLKFCKLDCLNDNGGSFVVPEDVPQTALIPVYQNGTCDNWFQARGSEIETPSSQYFNVLNWMPGGSQVTAAQNFIPVPYSGCFTFRTRIKVKTENIQVLDYAQLAATAGTFRRVLNFF